MRVIVFDTETTGLPEDRRAPPTATEKWPHIVQLSYILYDTDTDTIVDSVDDLVSLPQGVPLPASSTKVHGITESQLRRKGIPVERALAEFTRVMRQADSVVAHNLEFDLRVVQAGCHRVGMADPFGDPAPSRYCTMMNGRAMCAIWVVRPNGTRYIKYPKLHDLHVELFQEGADNLHDALADVLVCLRCYLAMAHEKDLMRCRKARQLYQAYGIGSTRRRELSSGGQVDPTDHHAEPL